MLIAGLALGIGNYRFWNSGGSPRRQGTTGRARSRYRGEESQVRLVY
jgi:hypothetical protein